MHLHFHVLAYDCCWHFVKPLSKHSVSSLLAQLCSSLNEIESVALSTCPLNRSGKIFYKVIASKAKPKLRRICCVNRAELNRLEMLFNDFSGECFFVYYASNLTIFPLSVYRRISVTCGQRILSSP